MNDQARQFYEDIIEAFSARYPRLMERNAGLFSVLHSFEDKIPLIEVLTRRDLLQGVMLKKSSTEMHPAIADKLRHISAKRGVPVYTANDIYANAAPQLGFKHSDRPFILADHGGYFAHALPELDRYFTTDCLGLTEHTLNGQQRTAQLSFVEAAGLPYNSTAQIDLKERSDREIAQSVADEIGRLALEDAGLDIYDDNTRSTILIIGYGVMGMHAAQRLMRQGCQARLCIADKSSKKLAFARQDGFEMLARDIKDILPQADMVLLATNTVKGMPPVLSINDINNMKAQACISSMTSLEDEIDMSLLRQSGVLRHIGQEGVSDIYETESGSRMTCLLGGKPANACLTDGGSREGIFIIEASGLAGAFKVVHHPEQSGLDEGDKEVIAGLWLKHFHSQSFQAQLN